MESGVRVKIQSTSMRAEHVFRKGNHAPSGTCGTHRSQLLEGLAALTQVNLQHHQASLREDGTRYSDLILP